jgi:hypothetical protein
MGHAYLRSRGGPSLCHVQGDDVIHLAFKHDIAFSGGFQDAADADRRAVEAIGAALEGSDHIATTP